MVELKRNQIGKNVIVDENPFSRWLFSNTTSVWIWLILTVYLGYSWLMAGIGKVTSDAWTGESVGVAIQGFMGGALSKVEEGDVASW